MVTPVPDPTPTNPPAPAEPALLFAVLASLLGLLSALHVGHLTTDQTGAIMTAVTAVFGAVTAALTRPIAPAAFTGAFTALVTAAGTWGLHLSPQVVGAGSGFIFALTVFIARGHIAPVVSSAFRR